jgi:hypothetical protein
MAGDLSRLHIPFDTIDIEKDMALERAYGEAIPVLFDGDLEIARAPQDLRSLERTLKRAGLL